MTGRLSKQGGRRYGQFGATLALVCVLGGVAPPAGGPNISSLSVTSGPETTSVVITGTAFGASQGGSTVKFNGTTATASAWADTSITVTVPAGATTGPVVVHVGSDSNGVTFTVTPHIASLSPTSGIVGSSVVITGTTFGASQGGSTVTVNGVTATASAWGASSITITVPAGASTGNVVVTVGGNASNGVTYTVTLSITSLTPNTGPVGTSVTIAGGGFGATQGGSTVTFNGTTASPSSWNTSNIVVPVPVGATTGPVVVTVGSPSNGVTFTVTIPGAGYVITIDSVSKPIVMGSLNILETANGRNTLSCAVDSPDGTYRPALSKELVVTENGIRIFGGYIDVPSETGFWSTPAGPAITTKIQAVDFNGYANRRYVVNGGFPAGTTLKAALTALQGGLAIYGVTLDPAQVTGPALPLLTYDVRSYTSILDELTTVTGGYVWEIDYNKVLRMFLPSGAAAPFNVVDGDGHAIGDISVTTVPKRQGYANRVWVRYGTGALELTETFTATAGQTVFPLTYPLIGHRGYVTVTVGGVPSNETLGTVPATWVLDTTVTPNTITRTSGLAVGNTVAIIYTAQFPAMVQSPLASAEPTAEQTANQLQEIVVDQPGVFVKATAQAFADAYLPQYIARPRTAKYDTFQTGIHPGQTQTITIATRNLSSLWLITDVQIKNTLGNAVRRTVTAIEGALYPGSWRDTIKQWGAPSSGGGGSAALGGPVIIGSTGLSGSGTTGNLAKWASASALTDGPAASNIPLLSVVNTFLASNNVFPGIVINGGSSGAGAIYKAGTTYGLSISGITGSISDLTLVTPGNAPILTVPTGTINIVMAGALNVAGVTLSGGSFAAGTLYKSAAVGIGLSGLTGSTYDLSLLAPTGASALSIVTGTTDLHCGGGIGVSGYVSRLTGWWITGAGAADFRNLYTDELTAKSFIADLEQALAGGQIICKSVAVIVGPYTVPTAGGAATLTVEDLPSAPNMAVFVSGDTVVLRVFSRANGGLIIGDAIGVVTTYAQGSGTQTWLWRRNAAATAGAMADGTVIQSKAIALDYGVSGNGYYEVTALDGTVNVTSITRSSTTATVTSSYPHQYLTGDTVVVSGADQSQYNGAFVITVTSSTVFTYTVAGSPATPATGTILLNGANGTNAPYAQVVTWATAPIGANKTLRTRFGNLRGVTGIDGEYGMLAGTYAATNGQYFRASNSAFELHGIALKMWDGSTNTVLLTWFGPQFAMGNPIPTAYGTGVGIWMGKDTAYKFRVGDPAGNRVAWDGTNLTIVSQNITIGSAGITLAIPPTTFDKTYSYNFLSAASGTNYNGLFATEPSANERDLWVYNSTSSATVKVSVSLEAKDATAGKVAVISCIADRNDAATGQHIVMAALDLVFTGGAAAGALGVDLQSGDAGAWIRLRGLPNWWGTQTTGAASVGLSNNSPATVPGTPYTWVKCIAADGTTCYFPIWK